MRILGSSFTFVILVSSDGVVSVQREDARFTGLLFLVACRYRKAMKNMIAIAKLGNSFWRSAAL